MSPVRTGATLVTLLGATLLLAACGSGGTEAATDTSTPSASSATSTQSDVVDVVELRVVRASDDVPASDSQDLQDFSHLDCAAAPTTSEPSQPLAACDAAGTKYLLEPAAVVGGVTSAQAVEDPAGSGQWAVVLQFDADSAVAITQVSKKLAPAQQELAIVVAGRVISAPPVVAPLTGGTVQVTGVGDQDAATQLASSLAP